MSLASGSNRGSCGNFLIEDCLRTGVQEFWVYILECADGSLYAGSTKDVKRRMALHNSGRGSRCTRARLPVALRYVERKRSWSMALKREYEIKKLSRSAKLLLCATYSANAAESTR